MKKFFYIDSILGIIGLSLFIIFFKNFKDVWHIAVGIIFSLAIIFVNIKFYKVVKYPMQSKFDVATIAALGMLIVGKIQFILMCLLLGLYNGYEENIFILPYFVVVSFSILTTTYIYENKIISLFKGVFLISEVKDYNNLGSSFGTKHLKIISNNGKKIRIRLTKEEYQKFLEMYKENEKI